MATVCLARRALAVPALRTEDDRPELLFRLRDVDAEDLVVGDMALPDAAAGDDATLARRAPTGT